MKEDVNNGTELTQDNTNNSPVLQRLRTLFGKREKNEFISQNDYSEAELVEAKSKELPPASKNLRISVQVPCQGEMFNGPVNSDTLSYQLRGNLAENLYSILNSLEKSKYTNPDEVELLYNVNGNPESENFNSIKVANQRSLELLRAINEFSNSNSENPKERAESLSWISQAIDVKGPNNKELDQVISFYTRLFEKSSTLINQGLQIHPIDCSKGERITKVQKFFSYEDIDESIGDKRRLLGSIGLSRIKLSQESMLPQEKKKPYQPMIAPLDGDTVVTVSYFDAISHHSQSHNESIILRSLPRTSRDLEHLHTYPNEDFANTSNKNLMFRNMYIREISRGLTFLGKKNKPEYRSNESEYTSVPWSGTYLFSAELYRQSGGWPMAKKEDSGLMRHAIKIADETIFIPKPLVVIKNRQNDREGGAGSAATMPYFNPELGFASKIDSITDFNQVFNRAFNNNEPIKNYENLIFENFAREISIGLSQANLTDESKALIQEFVCFNSEEKTLSLGEFQRRYRMKFDSVDEAALIGLGSLIQYLAYNFDKQKYGDLIETLVHFDGIFVGR